ncbi:hypothetical protein PENANT_c009G05182 [Penicillium antarcticum]|uniref:Uncharacterized protein n=1 Tax=Penicillium antarcticum TaxID=416450 RepID=A0A1V6Q944_9EURO|nr:hypothetical protein PENANT_c009G05182 [Penicillium antarcticum]
MSSHENKYETRV